MGTRKVAVSAQVRVHIDGCQGDLVLRGWDAPELEIRSGEDLAEDVIQWADGEVHLPELPECRLFVPRQAAVVIEHVAGDLRADGLSGSLEINNAGGDLRARRIDGTLRADEVRGDVRVRDLAGVLELGHVGGDAVMVNLRGGVEVRQVDGEAVLKTALVSGACYNVRARGNVVLKLPLQTNARLVLEAPDGEIHLAIPLEVEEEEAGRLVGTLGGVDERAEVFLHTADGSIALKPLTTYEDGTADRAGSIFDAEAIAEMVRAQVAAGLGTLDVGIDELVRRETERALQQAKRAQAKAERAAERAQAKVKRAAERAQRRVERQAEKADKRWGGARRKRWTASRQTSEPVTEEERVAILRMLAEGKITAEEANKLLEALEG